MQNPEFRNRNEGERVGRQLAETGALKRQAMHDVEKWNTEQLHILREALGKVVYLTGLLHSQERVVEGGVRRETFAESDKRGSVRLPLGWYVIGGLDVLEPADPLLFVAAPADKTLIYCAYVDRLEYPEPPRRPLPY